MKRGWSIRKLGDPNVLTIIDGDRGKNYPKKNDFSPEGHCLFLNTKNVRSDGFSFDKTMFITEEKDQALRKGKLRRRDVILTTRGTIGNVAIYDDSVDFEHVRINSGMLIFRPNESVIASEYLFRLFLSPSVKSQIERYTSGAAQPQLPIKTLVNFKIPIPPIAEQKRIVAILDEAFEGIEGAIANTEKNLANARELFESYLNAIFTHKGDGWVEKALLKLVEPGCSLSYGIVQPGQEYDGGLPVVRPTDLISKVISIEGLKRIDPQKAASYQRTKLVGGELLLCVRGSTGTVGIAADELEGANVTRGIVPIRFEPSMVHQSFGYYMLISKVVQDQVKERTYGAALMQINIRDLKKLTLPFPGLKEQENLAKALNHVEKETQRLEAIYQRKLTALNELKQSILQKAFTGELTADGGDAAAAQAKEVAAA